MSWTPRAALIAGLFAGLVGTAAPSAAKNLCGRIHFTDAQVYVLEKISTRPGAHGAVSGYFVRESDQQRSPFSGSYALFGDLLEVSVAQGVYSSGFDYSTRHHNFGAPLSDSEIGNDYITDVDGNAGTVTSVSPAPQVNWVDCKTVPKFLAPAS